MKHFLGIQAPVSAPEKLVSGIGAALSIYLVALITAKAAGSFGVMVILPSMGAAAVLLFAAPHAPLSQPWALFAGNLLSALVGVSCVQLFGDSFLSAAIAVGSAIIVMHLGRCLHPPGGATALAAVIGGDQVHALGYGYVIVPTLINCGVIFCVAMIFNNLVRWRHYPSSRVRFHAQSDLTLPAYEKKIDHIRDVMSNMKQLMDISPEQVNDILEQLALNDINNQQSAAGLLTLQVGGYYSNDANGLAWSVRKIIDEVQHPNEEHHMLVYRIVDGKGRHRCDSCTFNEFSQWAKVQLKNTKA